MKVKNIKKLIYLTFIYIFNRFPIKTNKIFFYSYYGSQYGCNPKYITEYIRENYPSDKFDIVWAFNHIQKKDELMHIRSVKNMSLKYFYELCTSKVIITNYRTTDLFVKRKGQYYIQTWHSSLRLKQIERDAENTLPTHYVEMAKLDSMKCDLLLSGCKFSTDIFKRSFWYTGEIFEHGTPRNDLFFQTNTEKRKSILNQLSISLDTRILLYAPTFRSENNINAYNIDYEKLIKTLQAKFGGNWKVLVRLHPHLLSEVDQMGFSENIVNVTTYDDVQELMFVADVLISDYSSLIFDFSITNKPCFLYIPDVQEYTKTERKLYFKLVELPFVSATTNDELFQKINHFNSSEYTKKLDEFSHKVGSFEKGRASEYLLKRICDVCFTDRKDEINEAI